MVACCLSFLSPLPYPQPPFPIPGLLTSVSISVWFGNACASDIGNVLWPGKFDTCPLILSACIASHRGALIV